MALTRKDFLKYVLTCELLLKFGSTSVFVDSMDKCVEYVVFLNFQYIGKDPCACSKLLKNQVLILLMSFSELCTKQVLTLEVFQLTFLKNQVFTF